MHLQHMLSVYRGDLQFFHFCAWTYTHDGTDNFGNISHLASIPSLALTLNLHGNHKAVERLLLGPTNIQRVILRAEYCEQTLALLEALSQTSTIVELCLYTMLKLEYVECSRLYNWTSNTSVTSLRLSSVTPGVLETSACMDWLLALDFSRLRCAPTHGLSFISYLTSLTSLRVSSEYVDTTSWTLLYSLKALANCSLEAILHYAGDTGYTTFMQNGSDALFCLDALTHLQVCAFFPAPEFTSRCCLRNVSSNICCLEFEGPDDVSDYFVYIVAKMPCLTKLSVRGKTFPFELSFISNLRWLKELKCDHEAPWCQP